MQGIFLFLSYMVAAIPFGVVFSKVVSGRDVRHQGSGNIGATNVARMMGKKWGVIVLITDALKGYIVVSLAMHIGGVWFCNLVAAVAVVAHCYPVYLKFKGGKGVATAIGVVAALSWTLVAVCVAVFIIGLLISRRISVGSLSGALALPIAATLLGGNIMIPTAWFLALLIWWKHKENIKRLSTGAEPKFF